MMPLESQVCSLELAKRLKELGMKQESYFYYFKGTNQVYHPMATHEPWTDCVSTFTVAELGEWLPKEIDGSYVNFQFDITGSALVFYRNISSERADTEANARAQMLINLIENGLVKV